jgi:hypothetical protein
VDDGGHSSIFQSFQKDPLKRLEADRIAMKTREAIEALVNDMATSWMQDSAISAEYSPGARLALLVSSLVHRFGQPGADMQAEAVYVCFGAALDFLMDREIEERKRAERSSG